MSFPGLVAALLHSGAFHAPGQDEGSMVLPPLPLAPPIVSSQALGSSIVKQS